MKIRSNIRAGRGGRCAGGSTGGGGGGGGGASGVGKNSPPGTDDTV